MYFNEYGSLQSNLTSVEQMWHNLCERINCFRLWWLVWCHNMPVFLPWFFLSCKFYPPIMIQCFICDDYLKDIYRSEVFITVLILFVVVFFFIVVLFFFMCVFTSDMYYYDHCCYSLVGVFNAYICFVWWFLWNWYLHNCLKCRVVGPLKHSHSVSVTLPVTLTCWLLEHIRITMLVAESERFVLTIFPWLPSVF